MITGVLKSAALILSASALWAADAPRNLCSLVPPELKLDPKWTLSNATEFEGEPDFILMRDPSCPRTIPCNAGIGTIDHTKTIKPNGMWVHISMSTSLKVPMAVINAITKSPSKRWGDGSSFSPDGKYITYALGPYYIKIETRGTYEAQALALATHIERQLKTPGLWPMSCDADAPAPPPGKPEPAQVVCPGATDLATINLSWSPGQQVRDVTIKVGTSGGADDIAIIGPIKGATTFVNNIPSDKTIHVTLYSNYQDGTQGQPTVCSFKSLGLPGILGSRTVSAGAQPGRRGSAVACFPSDPNAALLDPLAHASFASTQPNAVLVNNLMNKLRDIYNCRSMTGGQRTTMFADVSVAIAKRFRDARCFNNHLGVITTDWNAHKNAFIVTNEWLDNLLWKTSAAMRCLPKKDQDALFGEISAIVAGALDRR